MFVTRSVLVAFAVVAASSHAAYASELGRIAAPNKSYIVQFLEDARKETKITNVSGGVHIIPGFPIFLSVNKNVLATGRAPTRLQSQLTNPSAAFVVFENQVVLLRDGKYTKFDLHRQVDEAVDIRAFHGGSADAIALREGGRTSVYVLTVDGDFRLGDLSLNPSSINSLTWDAKTEKVVVNGNQHIDAHLAQMTKPANPKPFAGAAPPPSQIEEDRLKRIAESKAAFEADAAKRAADEKAGIVDLREHNSELLVKAEQDAGVQLFKDKDDKMVDLATYLRSNFTFVEKVQRNEIDVASFEKQIDLATTGLLMAQGGSVRVLGSAGVGKSHFQNTLLAAIFTGKTSPALTNRLYIKLTAAGLGGGTKHSGTFEERVRALKVLSAHVPLVLMIDEIHSLVGQGTHSGNNNDFFEYIKDELAEGKIKIIGATTRNEWNKHIASNDALATRFGIHVELDEPKPEAVPAILENFKKTRHPNSKLSVSQEQLEAITALATRFDPIDANPRKSIRLYDFILARAERSGATSVSNAEIIKEASLLYNYDISALTPDKIRTRILELGKHLDSKLIGLAEAKKEVVRASADYFVTQKSNVSTKPYGILVYGDAGAGKTELAKQTATGLGLGFTRIMMGDYATQASADDFKMKLALTIKSNPFQVLLLDEVEKSHPAVQAVLLRVLDEGRLSAKLSEYATTESELDASKLLIFAATNAARELPGHPEAKDLLPEVAERDGLSRYLLDRLPVRIGLPRAPVQNVFEIMKIKAKDMIKQMKESGYRINANIDELAQHLLMRVHPMIISSQERTNPIGFVIAKDASNPQVEVRFSVRQLEAELLDLKRDVSTHIVMNDAHAVDLHFDKTGALEMRAAAPICQDLFTRH